MLLQCVPEWRLHMLEIGTSSVIKQYLFDSFYEKSSCKPTHRDKHIDFLGLIGNKRSDSDLFMKLLKGCSVGLDRVQCCQPKQTYYHNVFSKWSCRLKANMPRKWGTVVWAWEEFTVDCEYFSLNFYKHQKPWHCLSG